MDIDRMKKARPALIRSAVASIIALVALIVASSADAKVLKGEFTTDDLVALVGVVVMLAFGIMSVRSLVNAIKSVTADHSGIARGTPVSFLVAFIGYAILLISSLAALGVNVGGLLLGGAFTGVVIGIAAQQTLGNFFAGVVLILMRPLSVGEHVYVRGGPIGGEYRGVVTEMSLFYVHLMTPKGPVQLPNAGVLASAIGPGARSDDDDDADEPEGDEGPEQGGVPGA
ncbi:MAG: small conductance mechanosensitive channel [Actinomycetota bacterium]|jgi:small-conductance mechanosensitive channel|nr:small conductance mechanosensitive channel [Actinomycetota bacterium]